MRFKLVTPMEALMEKFHLLLGFYQEMTKKLYRLTCLNIHCYAFSILCLVSLTEAKRNIFNTGW